MATSFATLHMRHIPDTLPFEIRTLHQRKQQATSYELSRFEIIWISQGSGYHRIDLTEHPIHNYTLFCIAPGQFCQLDANPGSEGFAISFTQSFLSEGEDGFKRMDDNGLFEKFFQCPAMVLDIETGDEIEDIVKKMRKEYDNYFLLRSEMLRRYVKIFLTHLKRLLEPMESHTIQNRRILLVNKFISLLERSFKEKKRVAEYAEELSVTPNYLNDTVKKTFGYPASYYIRQRIVLEAKRKAMYSGANMKEIAYELGFDDMAHFSKFFKNTSGVNFTQFKKDTLLHC